MIKLKRVILKSREISYLARARCFLNSIQTLVALQSLVILNRKVKSIYFQFCVFHETDNHYQLSSISLFLYFSLKFVNLISPRLPSPSNGHVYIIK